MGVLLLIGTRKGLFLIRGDDERRSFELEGPLLPGWSINHAIVDPRDGTMYACANSWVYGGTVQRSDDGGESWERLDGNGLPSSFGFGLALDPSDPDRAFVLPEIGAENRVTCDGRIGIYTTADAGASWELIVAAEPAWAAVLREAMSYDDEAVYAGTQSGHVYALRHDEVVEATRHLPPILSVEAAPI